MKRILLSLLLSFFTLMGYSSHMTGGEITWRCSANGNYIFTLKIYRDCSGSGFTTSAQTIDVTNHPNLSGITANFVSVTDLTQPGCGIDCNPANDPGVPTGFGSIEEYVFRSGPINLGNFTPPAAGWIFTWNLCCRNTLQNIAGSSSFGMTLRSKMFSYNGQVATPCFSNSPAFAERPQSAICLGYSFTYNHTAIDVDFDSLTYAWDRPADGFAPGLNILNYQAPYTVNSQMPGSPTLDANSGEVNINPAIGAANQGNFATCVRVDEFRCNIKISEIYREIQVGLSNCSGTVFGGGPNNPPNFQDPITNAPYVSITDTIIAGDSAFFKIKISDTDINTSPFSPQTLTLECVGAALDSIYFAAPNTGCSRPPCATLNRLTPYTFQAFDIILMNWKTNCNHLSRGLGCSTLSNVYTFVVKARDSFCPVPARKNVTVRIVVVEPPKLLPPKLHCLDVDTAGHVTLTWDPPTPKDTFNTFYNYQILRSTNRNGPFITIDSVFTNNPLTSYFSTSYTDTTINAQNQVYYYAMLTRCGCDSLLLSEDTSTVLATMKPVAVFNTPGSSVATLSWNSLIHPLPATTFNGYYYIYRNDHANGDTAVFVDSVYTDSVWVNLQNKNVYLDTLINPCVDSITWKIGILDSSGCMSWSALGGATFQNDTIIDPPVINCVSVLPNGNVQLDWTEPAVTDTGRIWGGYLIYQATASGGPYTLIDSIPGYLTKTYTDITANVYTGGPYYYYISCIDSCGMIESDSSNIVRPMILDANMVGGNVVLNWNNFQVPTQAASYNIYRKVGNGAWTAVPIGTTASLTYNDPITLCQDSVTYKVEVVHNAPDACISVSSVDGDSVFIPSPTIGTANPRCTAVQANGDVIVSWELPIDTANYFSNYKVYQSTNPAGPFNNLIATITNYNTGSVTHAGANANAQINYYTLVTRAGCDAGTLFDSPQSDTIASMKLNVTPALGQAQLSWNAVHNPALTGSGTRYIIKRRTTGIGAYAVIDSTVSLTYNDPISQCNVPYEYTVELENNLPCTSVSSAADDVFTYQGIITAAPSLRCVSVNANGSITLTWDTTGLNFTNFDSYEIYQNASLLTTVTNQNALTYTDATANGNAASYGYYMLTKSGCTGTVASPTNSATLNSIFVSAVNNNTNLNPGLADLSWNALPLIPTSGTYGVYSDYQSPGTPISIGTTSSLNFSENITDCDTGLTHYIRVPDNSGCFSQSNVINGNFTYRGNVTASPSLRCVSVNTNGSIDLTWDTTGLNFTNFNSYEIYRNSTLLTTVNTQATLTYNDATANGNAASYSYYLLSKGGCSGTISSTPNSNTMNSIFLTVANNNTTSNPATADLSWNTLPLIPTSGNYNVYSDYTTPAAASSVASITTLAYTENIVDCDTGLTHYIRVNDNSGCFSLSNVVNGNYTYLGNVTAAPSLRCVSVNPNGSIEITWDTTGLNFINYNEYEIYRNGTLLTTVNDKNTLTYTDATANGNTASYSYYMLTKSGCTGNVSSPTNSVTLNSIFLTAVNNNTTSNPATADLTWVGLPLIATSGNYNVFSDYTTPVAPSNIGNTNALNFSENIVDCDTGITHYIRVGDNSGCFSQSNIVSNNYTYLGNVTAAPSLRCVSVNANGSIDLTWDTTGLNFINFNSYEIYRNGTSLTSVSNQNALTYNDATANGNTASFSYYMLTKSGCTGNVNSPTNTSTLNSIFLTVANNNITSNPATADLNWNGLPLLVTSSNYNVFSDYTAPAAAINVGNTNTLSYSENVVDCDTGLTHYIRVNDNIGCFSQSNIVNGNYTYLGNVTAAPSLRCVSVNANGSIDLTWDTTGLNFLHFDSYEIYRNGTALTSITNQNALTYNDATANGNTGSYSYYMYTESGCTGNVVSPTNSVTLNSIYLTVDSNNTTLNPGTADLSWIGLPLIASSSNYNVYSDYTTPAAASNVGNTGLLAYSENVIDCDTGLTHYIQVTDNSGCFSQSNIVSGTYSYLGNVIPAPQIRCVSVTQPTGAIELTWLNTNITDFTNFNGYEIYRDNTLITTIASQATGAYTDNGTNGNTASHTYWLLTRAGCTGNVPSLQNSDTLNSIKLNVGNTNSTIANLSWNNMHEPDPIPGAIEVYNIYKEYPANVWTLLASNITGNEFHDTITICGDNVNYYLEQLDATGNCTSLSSVDGDFFRDIISPADPLIASVSVDPNDDQTVIINWIASSSGDVVFYKIYQKNSFGTWDSIGTVTNNFLTYSTINPAVDTEPQYYSVIAEDSCGNKSVVGVFPHRTVYSTAEMDICRSAIDIRWTPYLNMPGGIKQYDVYVNNGTGLSLAGSVSNNQLIYSDTNLVGGTIYCYYVSAVGNVTGREATSNSACDTAELLTIPKYSYLHNASVIDLRRVMVQAMVDTTDDVDVSKFKVQRSVNKTGPFYTIGYVQFNGQPEFSYLDNTAQTDEMSYYYRVITVDSCGNDVLTSNIGRTIFLNGTPNYNLTNKIWWNDYEEWLGGVKSFDIFRSVDGVWETLPVNSPLFGINDYLDNVQEIYQTTGNFCYRIAAYEGPGNTYGYTDTSYSNEFCLIQEPHLYVPSAFTPEGSNPVFKPEFIYNDAKNYKFSVFNRWGQKVFETENPSLGWNGTINGDKAPQDTYVYSVRLFGNNGQELNKSGRVTLLR